MNISGFTIQNSGSKLGDAGIVLKASRFSSIARNIIKDNCYGIFLRIGSGQAKPSDNTFNGNTITTNDYGIYLKGSNKNMFIGNIISTNTNGVYINGDPLGWANNNIFAENDIAYNNDCGIKIVGSCSKNNYMYHNNFIDNGLNAYDECNNIWHNDTIMEGNYWSDYTDQYPDPKDDSPPQGIWDEPYNIPGGGVNQDIYPLVDPWSSIPGDLNGDGDVDQSDLGILLAAWGTQPGDLYWAPRADINNDGCVDQSDLGILLSNWGYGT